jgi:hypothetical protein
MARLLIKTEGLENRTLELRLGVNQVGRDRHCDFPINHPTVSAHHCELILSNDGVVLRDCDSTNGTFVNGEPVREIWLEPGQQVRFGDVELLVESTEVNIAIPKYDRVRPPPAVEVLPDGAMICPRHAQTLATFKCPHCGEIMCSACVHVLKRKGGQPLFLCLICSNKCERLAVEKPKPKRGFIGFLDTVRLKFTHPKKP